jgi:Membrane bound FAD containing D-sorbitol dehydrogenase
MRLPTRLASPAMEPESQLFDEDGLSRGAFLGRSVAAAASLALARVPFAAAAAGSSKEQTAFISLSRLVTGVHELPRQHGPAYLKALNEAGLKLSPSRFLDLAGYAHGRGPSSLRELGRSPAYRARGGKECVDAIAAAWWSGIVPTRRGGQRVVTYLDALVWRAMPYAYPPTECLGAVGAWAKPGRSL